MSLFQPLDSFKLGSRTWKVELVQKRGQWLGKCSASRCRIRLNLKRIRNNEELRHTFFHELMHAICATMGWERLDSDEDKIDAIGNLLSQVEATAVSRWDE
jgi:Zn-dependent peptidase ImmA (M78 family)